MFTQRTPTTRYSIGMKWRPVTIYLVLFLVLILTAFVALTVGSANLNLGKVIRIITGTLGLTRPVGYTSLEQKIISDLRLPRIILAALVGGALSIAGVVFQGLFRNPMADPYIIGTSSGAALGAALGFVSGLDIQIFNLNVVPALAFTGAIGTTIVVYNLSRVGSKISMMVLLLTGVAFSFLLSSITSVIMILRRDETHNIITWMIGGFTASRWVHVKVILPYLIVGMALLVAFSRDLDLMLLGEEKAHQLGVNIQRLQGILTLAASLLVAAAVSFSGIIGFVGLVVPHMVRLIIGPNHKQLLPIATLTGAIFLLIADTVARIVLSPLELPVGIITAFLGAPFFIYLLRRNKLAGESKL
ncbi:MAG TPA: iron ABC transporter permease [Bacillota bacterium]|nr:iron ABC transporter permease [Bacillota bacterium]